MSTEEQISALMEDYSKLHAENTKLKKQIQLMHDNGLGESWVEKFTAKTYELQAEIDELKEKHQEYIASKGQGLNIKKCPICEGRCYVVNKIGWLFMFFSGPIIEECQACAGKGYVPVVEVVKPQDGRKW